MKTPTPTLPAGLQDYQEAIAELSRLDTGDGFHERLAAFLEVVGLIQQLQADNWPRPYAGAARRLADRGELVALKLWTSFGADLLKLLPPAR